MKRIVFITSHLYSGSDYFIKLLNGNPRIDIKNIKNSYSHPASLDALINMGHKLDNTSAIYGDHILFNQQAICKSFYNNYYFIFLIREAKSVLNSLVAKSNYTPLNACRYYCFRLRRIYEMCIKVKNSLLITWNDVISQKCFSEIELFLNLKNKLSSDEDFIDSSLENLVSSELIAYSQESYEKYLFKMKNQYLHRNYYR